MIGTENNLQSNQFELREPVSMQRAHGYFIQVREIEARLT